ncbi:response regulator [Natrinema halophilum]|nr:response regulator [Natrinema halophilum]
MERESERLDVCTAGSTEEGLKVLQTTRIDCILSDYHMPGQTGVEFLQSVRAIDDAIPFILFTETGSEQAASDSIEAGVTDYIVKKLSGTNRR